jgi:hypothetical protein
VTLDELAPLFIFNGTGYKRLSNSNGYGLWNSGSNEMQTGSKSKNKELMDGKRLFNM